MKTQIQENVARVCPCDLAEFCGKQTDEEIIEFVKENKECYAVLVERYEEKLTRYVKRISNMTKESIEDILQSVFLKTYVNLNSFDNRNKFSTWIYRIAHNETVNYWRKNSKGNHFVSLDENDFWKNIIPDNGDMGYEVAQRIDGNKVRLALENLIGNQKEALSLRFIDQLNYQEIADKLEKPIGTVGTLINRGKKVLQEELVKMGFSGGYS
jgi:RNA polymerase sigma-70 factor, ECF subfamily